MPWAAIRLPLMARAVALLSADGQSRPFTTTMEAGSAMDVILGFEIELNDAAGEWLRQHPGVRRIVIAYEEHRCCGGGKICDVRLRGARRTEPRPLLRAGLVLGREVLVDRRIVGRLPRRLPLAVRGIGPWRGLSLDLDGEQWADLLYASA